jgi:integrase
MWGIFVGTVISLRASTVEQIAGQDAVRQSRRAKRGNRARLTELRIETAQAPSSKPTYIYDRDVPGLAIRVMPSGVRTFVVVKKIAGKAQRITLGRWPGLRLADARRAAARINGEIAAGGDPVAQRKAARVRAQTCNDFWPIYLNHIKRKNRSWKRDEERWTRAIAPPLGTKALSSITTDDCQKLIDREGVKHPVKANRIAALLGAFFAFAMRREWVDRNPARGLSRYEETPRDRFLSGEEVCRFLAACRAAPQPWGDVFASLLWTGARKGAVMSMRWADLDLHNGVWRIPAASAKNKQPAAVPIVEPALEILRSREAFRDNSPWVFPAASKRGHVAHVAKAWAALMNSCGLSDLRPHDLRRTVGSWLAGSGASAFIIQKVLTHKSAASAKAYAHLDVEAVRAALAEISTAMQRGGTVASC